jgi:glycosyltransferase involved in cell wall biosynthesis
VRVLHVDTATEWRGGQQLLLRLARGMAEAGEDVSVACPEAGRLWLELGRLGLPRLAVPAGRSPLTPLRLAAARPDLLVAHTSHAHTCCLFAGLPLIVHRWVDFTPSGGWKYRRPEGYVACSEAVAAQLRAAGGRGVTVVYGGVDPLPPAAPAADGPMVLAVGARVAHKGHDVLAAAAALLPGLDVGVAGEGPLRPPGLRWLGERGDVPALLAAARVFVMPSRSEGQGMAVVEAMLAGVPVVASAVGGIPEVLGETGLLVPPGDAPALARALQRALAGDHPDPALARGRALALFTTARMVEGAVAAYRRIGGREIEGRPL